MALQNRFLSLIFLRSFLLRFLAALLSLRFDFPFPLTTKESSSETQGQIVGARESPNRAEK